MDPFEEAPHSFPWTNGHSDTRQDRRHPRRGPRRQPRPPACVRAPLVILHRSTTTTTAATATTTTRNSHRPPCSATLQPITRFCGSGDTASLAESNAAILDSRASRDILLFLRAASKDVRDQVFWGICLQVFELFRHQQLPLQSPWLRNFLSSQWPTPLRGLGVSPATSRYREEYEEVEELGHGGFGRVVRARNKLDGLHYAVKMVETHDMSECPLEACVPEVRTLATLEHPRVVRYITAWVEEEPWPQHHQLAAATLRELSSDSSGDFTDDFSMDNGVCESPPSGEGIARPGDDDIVAFRNTDASQDDDVVVFQDSGPGEAASQPPSHRSSRHTNGYTHASFLPFQPRLPHLRKVLYIQMKLYGKSLRKWIDDRNGSDSPLVVGTECLRIFHQVLEALHYIHGKGYMHRDVKPDNILFSVEGSDAHLGDFGLARLITHPPTAPSPATPPAPHTINVGTLLYTAPEVKKGNYGEKSDMYSVGIILLELFMVFKTYTERSVVIRDLKEKGHLDPHWTKRWPSVAGWITRLVDKDPERRPSASELLQSSLFPLPSPTAAAAATGPPVPAGPVHGAAGSVRLCMEEWASKDEEIAFLRREYDALKEENQTLMRRLAVLERGTRHCNVGDGDSNTTATQGSQD